MQYVDINLHVIFSEIPNYFFIVNFIYKTPNINLKYSSENYKILNYFSKFNLKNNIFRYFDILLYIISLFSFIFFQNVIEIKALM